MPRPKSISRRQNIAEPAEISDASISFQIPAGFSNEEFLLDSDPGEFLQDVAPTPGPSRIRLAISPSPEEPTPKPSRKLSLSIPSHPSPPITQLPSLCEERPRRFHEEMPIQSSARSPANATPRPTLRLTTGTVSRQLPEPSPVKVRIDSIRSELQGLVEEPSAIGVAVANQTDAEPGKLSKLQQATSSRTQRPAKPRVNSGGITKRVVKNSTKPVRKIPLPPKPQQEIITAVDTIPKYESTPRLPALSPPPPLSICEDQPTPYPQPQSPVVSNYSPGIANTDPDLLLAKDQPPPPLIPSISPKHDNALTISQLSPSKTTSHRRPSAEATPARLSTSLGKRPFSATASDDHTVHAQKKGRVTSSAAAQANTFSVIPVSQVALGDSQQHHHRLKPDADAASTASRRAQSVAPRRFLGASQSQSQSQSQRQLGRSRSVRNASSTSSRMATMGQVHSGSGREGGGGAASASGSTVGCQQRERLSKSSLEGRVSSRPGLERSSRAAGGARIAGAAESSRGEQENTKCKAKAPCVATDDKENKEVLFPLAKRSEFTFRADALVVESGKSQRDEMGGSMVASKRVRGPSQIPDYKVLHAQNEARRSQRRAPIVPTVPLPFQLHTENRVRERQVFDDHVREKEREMELMMEQKRREREEEAEREVKELRKRAIPKAHDLPEWYKDAPKRKTANDVGGVGGLA